MANWSTVELDGLARVGVDSELRRFSPAVRYPEENNGIFATRFARGVDGRRMVLGGRRKTDTKSVSPR
jgi:hypothetical protein